MSTRPTFVSYAGNLEDVILWRALGSVERGFYIDVGAYAPVHGSVTRAFWERGWHGVNVEPHPRLFRPFPGARPNDVNLNIAVGEAPGWLAFHLAERVGLSTLDPDQSKRLHDQGIGTVEMPVRVETLDAIWEAHVPPGQAVHFLKVDVEGYERQVVLGNDWGRHRPWIAVVEATRPLSSEPAHEGWESILTDHGYSLVYEDGLNRFYLAEEHPELRLAFRFPPNVFDGYVTHAELRALERATRAEDEVAALRRSRSFRLTAPIRAVATGARRLAARALRLRRRTSGRAASGPPTD